MRRLRDPAGATPRDAEGRPAREDVAQPIPQFRSGTADDGQALLVVRTALRCRGTDRGGRLRRRIEIPGVALDMGVERRGCACRDGEEVQTRGFDGPDGDAWGLLQHDVGVGAAETERADPREPGLGAPRPRPGLDRNRESGALQRDVWIEYLEPRIGRDLFVLEGQRGLDQSGDAGCRLEVTEVRLHGAEEAGRRALAEHVGQRLDLDRIAQLGARAVGLDIADLRRPDPCIGQRRPDDLTLRPAVGRGQRLGPSVLVHRAPADHGKNPIAVGERVREALQHDEPTAFTRHETVRGGRRTYGSARRATAC